MAGQSLLVCVEDDLTRQTLSEVLGEQEHTVLVCPSLDACPARVRETSPAALLLDLSRHPQQGLDSLEAIRASGNDLPIVVLCARDDIATGRAASALNANDTLYLPMNEAAMLDAIERTLSCHRLLAEVELRRRLSTADVEQVVGVSSALEPLKHHLSRLRDVDVATVLITGESGTGKDVVARSIHAHGPRRNRPLLEIDCSALPDDAFLRQLFGNEVSPLLPSHQRGSFSRGHLELADGGVVVLDRVCELSPACQEALERALETQTYQRCGGESDLHFDTTIVATTTRDLRTEVEEGRFRRGLFLRLGATSLHLPPLRERTTDIPILVHHFITRASAQHGLPRLNVAPQTLELLRNYRWPGNVRELRNLVERLVILKPGVTLQPEHLPQEVRLQLPDSLDAALEGCPYALPPEGVDLDLVERGLISQALTRTRGNQSAAARLLGISRYALRYRMEKHELTG